MSVTEPLEFGTLLRRVRTAAGLSQEELAERARMSAAAVSALERGSRKAPYRDTVALLLEALGAEEAERNALTEAAERARRRAAKAESNLEISRPEPAPAGDPHLRSNLQAQVTSFFGRDRELAELEALLQKHRLVTLVGAGGVGKTRLSLHLGERVLGSYPDGVWFVEFAPVSDPQFVASAIASSVGLGSISEADPVSALVGALRAKRMLLILDNCEHLVEELARTAEAIVRTCPQVTLLASSRQGLDVDGERTYRVLPLGMPEVARIATIRADLAMDFSAIRLFTDRAVSVGRGFELTDANAPIVADIVARLDGIPLAIELAAARVKVFSPAELRTRLDERFRLLTGGRRNALPRQQTLHALIGWSYDLLNDREKRLLQRLSVFAGGWTIEAAEAVCSDHLLEAGDVLDALVSLVDKSLVVAEQIGDAMRYRLLDRRELMLTRS